MVFNSVFSLEHNKPKYRKFYKLNANNVWKSYKKICSWIFLRKSITDMLSSKVIVVNKVLHKFELSLSQAYFWNFEVELMDSYSTN